MIDVKKVYEDAVVGAGEGAMAADVQTAPGGAISDVDILGHCDHNKEGGYMKDGCFHLPKSAMLLQKRNDEILAGKKKKNHKNNYIKDMNIIQEAEFDKKTINEIHKVKESDLRNFILEFFGDEISSAMYVQAIMYFLPTKTFYAKVIDAGENFSGNQVKFVNLDFKNGKFTLTNDLTVYSSAEIRKQYSDLYGARGWIVWGGI